MRATQLEQSKGVHRPRLEVSIPEKAGLIPRSEAAEKRTEPAGIKVLEQNDQGVRVAVHAGRRYSLEAEAARVRLRWKDGPRVAQLEQFHKADFAADSRAGQMALQHAEHLAAKRGIRRITCDIPDTDFARILPKDRQELLHDLQKQGYRVSYVVEGSDGQRRRVRVQDSHDTGPAPGRLESLHAVKDLSAADRKPPRDKIEVPRPPEGMSDARAERRFVSRPEVQEYLDEALARLEKSQNGRNISAQLPEGVTLRDLVARDKREFRAHCDLPTYTATLCERAVLSPTESGKLVHRISELRTLHQHPDEVLDGARMAEQRIDVLLDGKWRRPEIDQVIRRGDKHYIRDYKPVDLSKFEQTPAGQRWSRWMENRLGKDFRRRIQNGRNPFVRGMPKETRIGLRDYLRAETRKHNVQLEGYRSAYTRALKLDPEQVQTHVRPYYVFRETGGPTHPSQSCQMENPLI